MGDEGSPSRPGIGLRVLCVLGAGALLALAPGDAKRIPTLEDPDPKALLGGVAHRVIDGDSIELFVNGRVTRYELAGVDAPDVLGERDVQAPGASAARDMLGLLVVGERLSVMIDPVRPEDAAGHARAYVFREPDRMLVNLELVRLGLAKHPRRHGSWNAPAFEWAQEQARSARKGVWDPAFDAPAEVVVAPDPVVEPSTENAPEPVEEADPAPEPTPDPEPVVADPDDGMVYVTKSGSKYHRTGCRFLGEDGGKALAREIARKSFEPCKVCRPDDPDGD